MNAKTFTSLEFILVVISNIGIWLATTGSTINQHDAFIFSALSAGAYALARGLAKFNSDGKPFYQTTEFWIAVLGALAAIVGGLKNHIGGVTETELIAAITAATAIANGLRTPPQDAIAR